jgi:hypothetical protein
VPTTGTVGGGITAPLDVTVNGKHRKTMTLTSQYAWLYNQYPFTNDPNSDLLHPDWWVTECACVPPQTTPAPVVRNRSAPATSTTSSASCSVARTAPATVSDSPRPPARTPSGP